MKIKFTLLFFVSISLLLSCKTAEKTVKENSNEVKETMTMDDTEMTPNNTLIEVIEGDSLFASISRSACYGRCPTYKLYIYFDGTVILDGIRFMEPIGKYSSKVSKEEIQAFIDKANEIEFMKMDDKYDSAITDIPSTTTSIVIDGVRKEVLRRQGYPQTILLLEQLFDELLTTKEWTPIEN
jgi:hypothetical protein